MHLVDLMVVNRLTMPDVFGTGEQVKVYRRQLDLKNRVVDRGIIFIRMTVNALAVGLVVLVS